MSAKEKIKQTAVEEAERIKTLTTDAARSGAYLYPLKGIFYFMSHRALWKPLLSKLAPTITMGIGIISSMFFFTYLPQAAVLALVNGPLAAVSAALLVLSESSTIFMVLAKSMLIEGSLIDTFDGTLLSRDQASLVQRERPVKSGRGDAIARLGKLATKPFAKFTPSAIIRYFMYLPLNFIPVVGTVLFVILQGRRYGPTAHSRYFQLKGMNASSKEKWIQERQAAYASFGVPAVLLEMVPIAGIFFAFTNTVGAALWAADLEAGQGTSPELRKTAEKAQ
ncbi:hypothetical protein LTR50_007432 [Elasticomyces elasticus]|nr:hypothetical protein LTR50_007432 [Elasticomyces elasticus]